MLIRFHTEIIAFQTRVGRLYRTFPYEKSWPIFVCIMTSWYFRTVVLEKTLESSLDSKKIKPVNPKWNQSWIFIGRTDAEAKAPHFGHLMRRTDSLEKTMMLGKIEGRRRRDDRGWDGWMASPTQWTWVWENSESWWRTGRPGVLQSMGSQRVRHDWVTELNWTEELFTGQQWRNRHGE